MTSMKRGQGSCFSLSFCIPGCLSFPLLDNHEMKSAPNAKNSPCLPYGSDKCGLPKGRLNNNTPSFDLCDALIKPPADMGLGR